MAFPEAFIDELVARNPIEDVVGQYVTLKRSGANMFGLSAWIKYRYLDGKNPKAKPLVQYGLSQTTINFDDNTYVDHVMLVYDENGKFVAEYDEETGEERKIHSGTIMSMIADALN